MRVLKGTVAHPHTKKPLEVVLVRPPLYLTVEEYDLLCARAVAAGLAPPKFLDRGRRARVRQDVIAELCRRAVLTSLCGVTSFGDVPLPSTAPNHPLRAYQRQRILGGRFPCRACENRRGGRLRYSKHLRAARRRVAELEAKLAKATGRPLSKAALGRLQKKLAADLLEPLPEAYAKGYAPKRGKAA